MGGRTICQNDGRDMGISACLIGMTLGAVLVAVSKWSKEALGIGDALLILMIGMGMGIYQTALVVFYALFVTSVVCAVLLMMKRVGKKTRIPFVPFLLLGYVGVILSWQDFKELCSLFPRAGLSSLSQVLLIVGGR